MEKALYFTAPWCVNCKNITPLITKFTETYKDRIEIQTVDVDTYPNLAEKYGVKSIPQLVLIKDAIVVDTIVGVKPKTLFESKLNSLLE